MDINLRIEPGEAFLYVRMTGTFLLREAQELSLRYYDTCVEHGFTKVLVDVRSLKGTISMWERWDYSVFLADRYQDYLSSGKLQKLRLAYLGKYPIIDPGKFGETVAVNRGLDVVVTTEPTQAANWLEIAPGTIPVSAEPE